MTSIGPPGPGVDPRHDPKHASRIVCGACGWEIARSVDVRSFPELDAITAGRVPTLPVADGGWRPPLDPRGEDWEIWEPTGVLRSRTAHVVELLRARRIRIDAAIRQARPRMSSSTRRRLEQAGLPIHRVLHIPCGVICPGCGQVNWFTHWPLNTARLDNGKRQAAQ